MQNLAEMMRAKAGELLQSGAVHRVLGWKSGDLFYNPSPAWFDSAQQLEDFVYDAFCAANLSKYLRETKGAEGKALVFLKPCDTYSFNQLLSEHKFERENVHVVGVGCRGMLDMEKIKAQGIKGVLSVEEQGDVLVVSTLYGEKTCPKTEVLLEKCLCCKGGQHKVWDEQLGVEDYTPPAASTNRFDAVEALEALSPAERFDFWQEELSKCIRCNACRNICPACTCVQCVFDSSGWGVGSKASADPFEDSLYHIVRATHVAGRCTDCGECSRVCPQGIPLHLLNRKMIKDIEAFYGPYQAGIDAESGSPLTSYTKEDVEPGVVATRGGGK